MSKAQQRPQNDHTKVLKDSNGSTDCLTVPDFQSYDDNIFSFKNIRNLWKFQRLQM